MSTANFTDTMPRAIAKAETARRVHWTTYKQTAAVQRRQPSHEKKIGARTSLGKPPTLPGQGKTRFALTGSSLSLSFSFLPRSLGIPYHARRQRNTRRVRGREGCKSTSRKHTGAGLASSEWSFYSKNLNKKMGPPCRRRGRRKGDGRWRVSPGTLKRSLPRETGSGRVIQRGLFLIHKRRRW